MGVVKTYQKIVGQGGFAGKVLSPLDATSTMLNIAKVTLTSAQIKALYTTPITLVAAPGANSFIALDKVVASLTYSTNNYTGANALEIRETDGSGTKVTADFPAASLNTGANAISEVNPIAANTTRILNAAIVCAVPVANPAGNNAAGTIAITTYYKVVTP
jgi:hypothetical protein